MINFNGKKKTANLGGSSGGGSGSGSGSGSKGGSINKSSSNGNIDKTKMPDDRLKTKTTPLPEVEPKVDMKSIVNLGYGPISAERLDELIREGKVVEYQDGPAIKYRKVFNYK